jgi:hypothetical protein
MTLAIASNTWLCIARTSVRSFIAGMRNAEEEIHEMRCETNWITPTGVLGKRLSRFGKAADGDRLYIDSSRS